MNLKTVKTKRPVCPRCEGYVITDYDIVTMASGAMRVDIQQCLVCGWEKYIDRNVKAQVQELARTHRRMTRGEISKAVGVDLQSVHEWIEEQENGGFYADRRKKRNS